MKQFDWLMNVWHSEIISMYICIIALDFASNSELSELPMVAYSDYHIVFVISYNGKALK